MQNSSNSNSPEPRITFVKNRNKYSLIFKILERDSPLLSISILKLIQTPHNELFSKKCRHSSKLILLFTNIVSTSNFTLIKCYSKYKLHLNKTFLITHRLFYHLLCRNFPVDEEGKHGLQKIENYAFFNDLQNRKCGNQIQSFAQYISPIRNNIKINSYLCSYNII